jgi:hypothetical protein
MAEPMIVTLAPCILAHFGHDQKCVHNTVRLKRRLDPVSTSNAKQVAAAVRAFSQAIRHHRHSAPLAVSKVWSTGPPGSNLAMLHPPAPGYAAASRAARLHQLLGGQFLPGTEDTVRGGEVGPAICSYWAVT